MAIKPLGELVRAKDRRTRWFKDRDERVARLGLRVFTNDKPNLARRFTVPATIPSSRELERLRRSARASFEIDYHDDGRPRASIREIAVQVMIAEFGKNWRRRARLEGWKFNNDDD